MPRFWKKYGVILILVVAIVALATVAIVRGIRNTPHFGHDHGYTSHTPTDSPDEYLAKNSYKIEEASDGTYIITVRDHAGEIIWSNSGMKTEPTVTVLDDATLCVAGNNGNGITRRWGALYNVRTGKGAYMGGRFITAKGENILYLDNLTDAWHVFLHNAFDETVPLTATTLEGAAPDENGEVIESFKLNDDGDLSVEYLVAEGGTKTIVIDLP